MAFSYQLSVLTRNCTLTTCSCVYTVSTTVKDYMRDNDASLDVIVFECDRCGEEHVIEDASGISPLQRAAHAPKDWLFIRFGEISADEPLDTVLCPECKGDFLKSVGYSSDMEYAAVVSAHKKSAVRNNMFIRNAVMRFAFRASSTPIAKTAFDIN